MKKVLTIAIAAALCLSMIACAKKNDEDDNKTKTADTTEAATEESIADEQDTEDASSKDSENTEDTDPDKDEPTYTLSDFEGLYVYENERFLRVDANGNWEITTGREENMSGTLYEEDSHFYVDIYGQKVEVELNESGAVVISGQTFVPTTSSQLSSDELDMAYFEGDWYLNGDINATFYYHVNADGSWNQYERTSEGADNIDSGYTVSEGNGIYSLVSDYGPSSVAEYDEAEDTMYINGDAYSR